MLLVTLLCKKENMEIINKIVNKRTATSEETQQLFNKLETVSIEFMIGKWKGDEILTGHPMNGFLASSGWYGKIFESAEKVHPLIFYTDAKRTETFIANPTDFMAWVNKNTKNDLFLGDFRKEMETTEFKARLRRTEFRSTISATMIYDELPINDIFKKIDENTVLGIMDLKNGPENYFFILERDHSK